MYTARLLGRQLRTTSNLCKLVNQRLQLSPLNPLCSQLNYNYRGAHQECEDKPNIKLVVISAKSDDLCLSYLDRNRLLGRRLSPCLSIYKKQITSVMSILLRLSGFALAIGVWSIGLAGILTDRMIDDWAEQVEAMEFNNILLNSAKFLLALPFAYHFVAGARHIIWNLNLFLTIPQIYATGYVAIVLTIVLAVALTMCQVAEKEELQINDVDFALVKKK